MVTSGNPTFLKRYTEFLSDGGTIRSESLFCLSVCFHSFPHAIFLSVFILLFVWPMENVREKKNGNQSRDPPAACDLTFIFPLSMFKYINTPLSAVSLCQSEEWTESPPFCFDKKYIVTLDRLSRIRNISHIRFSQPASLKCSSVRPRNTIAHAYHGHVKSKTGSVYGLQPFIRLRQSCFSWYCFTQSPVSLFT